MEKPAGGEIPLKIAHRNALFLLLAAATLTVMAGAAVSPITTLMGEALGVDVAQARLLITTHGIMIAICSPLVGVIIDRVGAKRPFAAGLILYGVAGSMGIYTDIYWVLIMSRILLGVAVAAIFTSVTVLILNIYTGRTRNCVMGWRGSAASAGGVVWPLLGGWLGSFSWHLPFAIYTVGVPLGLAALVLVPDVRSTDGSGSASSAPRASVLTILRRAPILFAIYGLIFLGNVALYSIVLFIPAKLQTVAITGPFLFGLFIAGVGFASAFTSLFFGRIRSRLSYRAIVAIALLGWAVSLFTISYSVIPATIALGILFFGASQGLLVPAVALWVGETVPPEFRGRAASYLGTFGFIGQFFSPIILSPIGAWLGVGGVYLITGAVCAAMFVLWVLFKKR